MNCSAERGVRASSSLLACFRFDTKGSHKLVPQLLPCAFSLQHRAPSPPPPPHSLPRTDTDGPLRFLSAGVATSRIDTAKLTSERCNKKTDPHVSPATAHIHFNNA